MLAGSTVESRLVAAVVGLDCFCRRLAGGICRVKGISEVGHYLL